MAWDAQSMRGLLEHWDAKVRDEISRFDELTAEAAEAGSVLRPPASEELISQAEQRLAVRFPPSYRAFLQVSNGAYASSLGAELASDGWRRHGLLPVEEVALAREADTEHVDLWTEGDGLDDPDADEPARGVEPVSVAYYGH